MRRPLTVIAGLGAVWLGALILATPEAGASLAQPNSLSTKRLKAIPPEIRPVGRPRAIPATIKRERPGEGPVGPPVRRGKGLAQPAPQSEDDTVQSASR